MFEDSLNIIDIKILIDQIIDGIYDKDISFLREDLLDNGTVYYMNYNQTVSEYKTELCYLADERTAEFCVFNQINEPILKLIQVKSIFYVYIYEIEDPYNGNYKLIKEDSSFNIQQLCEYLYGSFDLKGYKNSKITSWRLDYSASLVRKDDEPSKINISTRKDKSEVKTNVEVIDNTINGIEKAPSINESAKIKKAVLIESLNLYKNTAEGFEDIFNLIKDKFKSYDRKSNYFGQFIPRKIKKDLIGKNQIYLEWKPSNEIIELLETDKFGDSTNKDDIIVDLRAELVNTIPDDIKYAIDIDNSGVMLTF